MKVDLIKGAWSDSKKAIIFFAGFGIESCAYNLKSAHDIYFVHDYESIEPEKIQQICKGEDGKEIKVVGYSLGVAIASRIVLPSYDLAIGGTAYGIHRELGIPPRIFMHTMKNFNPKDFAGKIGIRAEMMKQNCQEELKNIYSFLESSPLCEWKKALSSSGDMIFTPEIMRTSSAALIAIEGAHFIFSAPFNLDVAL